MAFRPGKPFGPEPEVGDAINPYTTNNPTVVLPQGGRLDTNDVWEPGSAPDVTERFPGSRPLQSATEDLWALSAPATPPDRGEWQRSNAHEGRSDFLLMEPPPHPVPAAPPSRPRLMGSPASSGSSGSSHGGRNGSPLPDDPLRPMALALSVIVEQQLAEQGVTMLERTPERIESVRRLARSHLRRDRAFVEAIPDANEAERLLMAIVDETLGYGPLDPLLRDETVSEILVTGPRMTYVEQGGRLYEVPVHFEDDAHLLRVIGKILRPLGAMVTPQSPIADVRLPDGTRVNVVIPPSATSGPTLTIRRALRRVFTLEQLVRLDVLSLHMADFLRLCVNARLNIAISGGPGSGKTTLLNALASTIDDQERIVKIEETLELQLHQRHIVPLETRLPGPDGTPGVQARDLVRNALLMRCDRLLLGECRGPEALALIQAMNSGYDGTMTTIYASNPRDALQRLESLCLMAGVPYASTALRQQLATGIDLIVHCAQLRDGSRHVTHITDVVGMEGEAIVTADLFMFREAGLDMATGRLRGEFAATGLRPTFANRIEDGPLPLYTNNLYQRGA